jgi:hypothetical protein
MDALIILTVAMDEAAIAIVHERYDSICLRRYQYYDVQV